MSKVFMTCTGSTNDHPFVCRDFERLLAFSAQDRHKKHCLVECPEDADIVVFAGSARANFSDVTRSDVYSKFRRKAVLFFSGDRGIPILPGVYACLERRRFGVRPASVGGFYLRVTENDSLDVTDSIQDAEYLFSFVGNARNHPVREEICNVQHPRALLKDTSMDARKQTDGVSGVNRERGLFYRDVMASSKFVVCPRGFGVCTWRLFETMRAGRVPVVISDAWIRPPGPEWETFCVFVPEAQVSKLSNLLEQEEPKAPMMGTIARKEWERWYAEENVFNTAVEHLLLAHERRKQEGWKTQMATYADYLEPYFLRHWVLSPLKTRAKNLSSSKAD